MLSLNLEDENFIVNDIGLQNHESVTKFMEIDLGDAFSLV